MSPASSNELDLNFINELHGLRTNRVGNALGSERRSDWRGVGKSCDLLGDFGTATEA